MSNTDIHDERSEFWRRHFEQAREYEDYLETGDPSKAKLWRQQGRALPPLTPEQCARLQGYNGRQFNVLMYSGIWCGDCVRQGPMLKRIAEACGRDVHLRIIDREASEPLKEELRLLGGARVPVVVFLSEDFFEVGRFGDRLLSDYRRLGRGLTSGCPTGLIPPPADEQAAGLSDWVDVFERMLLMLRLSNFLRNRHGD